MSNEPVYLTEQELNNILNVSLLACMYRVKPSLMVEDIQKGNKIAPQELLAGFCGLDPRCPVLCPAHVQIVQEYIANHFTDEVKANFTYKLISLQSYVVCDNDNNNFLAELVYNYKDVKYIKELTALLNLPYNLEDTYIVDVSYLQTIEDFQQLSFRERRAFYMGNTDGFISQSLKEQIYSQSSIKNLQLAIQNDARDVIRTLTTYSPQMRISLFDLIEGAENLNVSIDTIINELKNDNLINLELNADGCISDFTYQHIINVLNISHCSVSIYLSSIKNLGNYIHRPSLLFDFALQGDISFSSFECPLNSFTLKEYMTLLAHSSIKLEGEFELSKFVTLYTFCKENNLEQKINYSGINLQFTAMRYVKEEIIQTYIDFLNNRFQCEYDSQDLSNVIDSRTLCFAISNGYLPYQFEFGWYITKEDFNLYLRDNKDIIFKG